MRLTIALALMLLPLSWRLAAIRALRRKGKPIEHPWRFVLHDSMMWLGVILVATAINRVAGEVAFTIVLVGLLTLAAKGLVNAPSTLRVAWHHIGDPGAWRGEPAPVEGVETLRFGHLLWHKLALGLIGTLALTFALTVAGSR
ncbi:MAG TPA: hypothetical protein VIK61_02870 [Acidimicrobiia bacterium]